MSPLNPWFVRALAVSATCWLVSAGAQAGSAEINDDINARIARSKSQQLARAASLTGAAKAGVVSSGGVTAIGGSGGTGSAAAAGALGNGCNIAIGNVFEDKPAGVSTSAKRETTVIVTGDVIQVGNNCR